MPRWINIHGRPLFLLRSRKVGGVEEERRGGENVRWKGKL